MVLAYFALSIILYGQLQGLSSLYTSTTKTMSSPGISPLSLVTPDDVEIDCEDLFTSMPKAKYARTTTNVHAAIALSIMDEGAQGYEDNSVSSRETSQPSDATMPPSPCKRSAAQMASNDNISGKCRG